MALLRSMLYFPANSVRMVTKAATLPTDAVIFDLEDAVSLDDKETGRTITRDCINLIKQRRIHTFVRVNSLTTGLTLKDLESTVVQGLDGIMLAKTETKTDITELSKMLDRIEKRRRFARGSINLIPLIETAKGVVNSLQIASGSPRVIAVAFGAGDYYRDLGRDVTTISDNAIELLYARSTIVNTSRAAGVPAIDTPYFGSLTNVDAFTKEVKLAVQLGFKGKQCIHPSQIETVNTLFSPTEEEIARAERIVHAFEQSKGAGVISFEGKMADIMTLRQAKDTLTTAQAMQEKKASLGKASSVRIAEIFSQSPTRKRKAKAI